ncbi:MmyB-like transcription regulator ligand binding [Caulobacteraceae bacterium]
MVDEVAGFVPVYKVIDLSAPEMAQTRRAITLILTRHEPWPAFVLDRDWTVLAANDAAQRLVRLMLGESRMARPMNLMRLFLAPDELRRHIVNWPAWAGALLARARREAAAAPDDAVLQSVVRDLVALADADQLIAGEGALSPEPLCELRFLSQSRALGLIPTTLAFATPADPALAGLRIEAFLPSDDESETLLLALAGGA